MKWRSSVVYLVILALLGGYFYYFEVIRKEEKETAEKEAKKIFHFQADSVRAMEIIKKDAQPLQLGKEADWKILGPIRADVDKTALESLLNSLAGLQQQREINPKAEDLKPYGLAEPSLRVRAQIGDQWQELLLGDKSPAGGGRYAKTAESARVFLIAETGYSLLNKGLDELRKRELFSFLPDDVVEMDVTWQDGSLVHVKQQEGGTGWQAPDQPGMKIKKSKVKNVLDQIQWLRATKFLDNEVKNLEPYGLTSPLVTVKLRLKQDKTVELRLAMKDKEKRELAAVSSELPAVVEIGGDVMTDLPKNVAALEDRSLFGAAAGDVTKALWVLGEANGTVVQTGENKWALKKGEAEPQPLKDTWQVKSMLWDLGQAEYQKKLDPAPSAPEHPRVRLELFGGEKGDKSLVALVWDKAPEKESEPMTVWIQSAGSTEAVQMDTPTVKRVEGDLERLLQPEKEAGAK